MRVTRQQAVEEDAIERRGKSSTTVSCIQLQYVDNIVALDSVHKLKASGRERLLSALCFQYQMLYVRNGVVVKALASHQCLSVMDSSLEPYAGWVC